MTASDAKPPGDWVKSSLCSQIDPELWFPAHARDAKVQESIAICQQCPVIEECKAYADEIEADFGVWGGELRGTKPRRKGFEWEHGTATGARRHYRNGEKPCGPCLEASQREKRERYRREHSA